MEENVTCKYCAFIDLLGFKKRIEDNFEETVEYYENYYFAKNSLYDLRNTCSENVCQALGIEKVAGDTKISMFSDSIIISSSDLIDILEQSAALTSWFLTFGFLLRGGIGYGKFSEINSSKDILLVSEGLVQAVEIESNHAKYPRIMLHNSVIKELKSYLNESGKTIAYLSDYLIQDESDSWFINPFYTQPNISDIYERNERNIKKYEGYEFCDKYIWFQYLCYYFLSERD